MKRSTLRRYALATIVVVVIMELGAYIVIAAGNRFLSAPILRASTIYDDQSNRIRRLIADETTLRDVVDPELGWRYRPGYEDEFERINDQGMRSNRNYSEIPTPGVTRIAAFGDSFVYGLEVANDDAWSTRLELLRSDVELLNYGVGGYGTDQSLLRYRLEGHDFKPSIVIFGFAPTDMRRSVNVYRRFISPIDEGLATKPRFRLDDRGQLQLIPSPISSAQNWQKFLENPKLTRELGQNDAFYDPFVYENPIHDYSASVRLTTAFVSRLRNRLHSDRIFADPDTGEFNTNSEAFELQVALLTSFQAEIADNGALPVLLHLPDRAAIVSQNAGTPHGSKALFSELPEKIVVWDPTDEFASYAAAHGIDQLFAPGGHYSAIGNEVLAQWISKKLF